MQYKQANDESSLLFKPALDEPIDKSEFISDAQVGWVHIYETRIDYPIMQGEDNYEYLNKDPFGDFKLSGSIFMDYRNAKDFSDSYTLIYGHHMEFGAMFGALDEFVDEDYFNNHRRGRIVTGNKVYDYMVFAVIKTDAYNKTIFKPFGRGKDEVEEYIKDNHVIYKEPDNDGRFVALSTCTSDGDQTRLILVGTIIEKEKTFDEEK